MAKQAFVVEGDFQMGRARQAFSLQVVAKDEAAAREHIFTDLGSRHGAERRHVAIKAVRKISGEDLSAVTRHRLK